MSRVVHALALIVATACSPSSNVSRELGAICDSNSECADRCLGPSADWPDGFCTLDCDTDDDCGASDAVCIDEGGGGACAFTCADDRQCSFLGAYACKERDAHEGGGAKVMICRGT